MPVLQPHLVLVGMMGSGKTTVGRRLARRLGWRHVDADRRVERRAGKPIPEIFAAEGEEAFRHLEQATLEKILRMPGHCVVSTGGGAVLRPANRELMRERGVVVWLRADPNTLSARVRSGKGRPLLQGDAKANILRITIERAELYEAASHYVVDVDGLAAEEVADRVLTVAALSTGSPVPSLAPLAGPERPAT